MKLSAICFTQQGAEKLLHLKNEWREPKLQCFYKGNFACEEGKKITEGLKEWAEEEFRAGNAILFIGAAGIAVRAIAPFVKDKLTDSPVLVMDERADFVIPILSGHVGGANELAFRLADFFDAQPVITTATDIENKFAIDLFAKKNNLIIANREGIAKVSSKILRGEKIQILYSKEEIKFSEDSVSHKELELVEASKWQKEEKIDVCIESRNSQIQALLTLKTRNLILGIGCRRGKTKKEIEEFLQKLLERENLEKRQIKAFVSIDVKKEEEGILSLAKELNVPFFTYSSKTLEAVQGIFNDSEYVKKTVGVGNVCERSIAAYNKKAERIVEKQAENGITLAVGMEKQELRFE